MIAETRRAEVDPRTAKPAWSIRSSPGHGRRSINRLVGRTANLKFGVANELVPSATYHARRAWPIEEW
jgi:hypothetical protein